MGKVDVGNLEEIIKDLKNLGIQLDEYFEQEFKLSCIKTDW